MDAHPVAIVTGSATGNGAAIAQRLAARGWDIAVNYTRSEAEAEDTAQRCRAAGADAIVCRADISVDDDCRRMAVAARERWGRIDALVNNAGVTKFAPAHDLEALDASDFQRILSVNLIGAYQMTRAVAADLKASAVGSVVNISSHGGFSGLGSSMAYAASKGALNTLTLALARALAPDVRVNAVCPGFVDTRWISGAMSAKEHRAFRARVEAIAPLGRMPDADDVAEAALWFIEGGRCVTGQLLVVDSGVHLTVSTPVAD